MEPIKVLAIAWTNLVGGMLSNEDLEHLVNKRKVSNERVRSEINASSRKGSTIGLA